MTNAEYRPVEDKAASEEFGGSADQINPSERETDRLHGVSSVETGQKFRATSADTLMVAATVRYLAAISDDPSVTLQEIRDALLDRVNGEYAIENIARKEANSSSPPLVKVSRLGEHTVAQVLLARRRIIAVDLAEGATEDMTHLATYVEEGEDRGVYDRSEKLLKQLASELQPSLTSKGISSVIERLKTAAPVKRRTIEPHLIPVGNGVFDHARQELREFSPQWVFLSKIPAPYDPAATGHHHAGRPDLDVRHLARLPQRRRGGPSAPLGDHQRLRSIERTLEQVCVVHVRAGKQRERNTDSVLAQSVGRQGMRIGQVRGLRAGLRHGAPHGRSRQSRR
jgi:putative DNA primase/helicase